MRSVGLDEKAKMGLAQHPCKFDTAPLNLKAGRQKKPPAPGKGHAVLALRGMAACRKKI